MILCVDDEEIILLSLKNELRQSFGSTYDIALATSGREAIELIKECVEEGTEVPIILTDYLMPMMRGDELLEVIQDYLPRSMKIMLTGHATTEGVAHAVNKGGIYRFLFKPWNAEDLAMTLHEALKSYQQGITIDRQHEELIEINAKLAATNQSLEKMNQHLEDLVQERTQELLEVQETLIKTNSLLMDEKEQLRLASITDSLTQLYNRGYVLKRLQEEIAANRRYGGEFCALLLDIDDFKHVNDTYGHLAGDEVLRGIARIFKSEFRETDIVGRYGGEEFLVILTNTGAENGMAVAERVNTHIGGQMFGTSECKVTMSGGLVSYSGESTDELLMKVDDLLYKAKNEGKNRILQ